MDTLLGSALGEVATQNVLSKALTRFVISMIIKDSKFDIVTRSRTYMYLKQKST